MTDFYPVSGAFPGKLAVVARPRGGEWLRDEIAAWKKLGITTIVSHLTPEETQAFDLENEAGAASHDKLQFVSYPIEDRGIPVSREDYARFVQQLADRLRAGENLAIHCRQSLGRAPLTAIAILKALGQSTQLAIANVRTARGREVPETIAQLHWLNELKMDPEPTAVMA